MVVLSLDAMKSEPGIPWVNFGFVGMKPVDKRPARIVTVNNQFKNIVVKIHSGEIPVVVIALIQKIEPVQSFYPTHSDRNIQIVGVEFCNLPEIFRKLVAA